MTSTSRRGDRPYLQAYVDALNKLLNTTVTSGRLVLSQEDGKDRWLVQRWQRGAGPMALELQPTGNYLFVLERIKWDGSNPTMEECNYRYSTSPDLRDEAGWVVRFEFSRAPLPNQPHSHLHLNAVHKHSGSALDRLHLPAGLVSLEQFLAHLLLEQGVEPLPGVAIDEALDALRRGHEEFSYRRTNLALFP